MLIMEQIEYNTVLFATQETIFTTTQLSNSIILSLLKGNHSVIRISLCGACAK
jgi:hypothetical protein